VPRVPYSTMKPIRLIHSHAVLTVGEIPFLVSMMPWTIHGWRPLSVSSQPAVFIRNGRIAPHTATHKNTRDVASVLRCSSQSPHTQITRTRTPR
jgi:hypothetical protein